MSEDLSSAQPPSGPVTLEDIARAAGVHIATASRALRPSAAKVADATRQRVQQIARELGYRPNEAAATLRTRRSNLIGIVVTDLANPLFGPVLQGLETELRCAGWMSLIVQTAGVPPGERRDIILALAGQQVGGLIIAAAEHDDPLLHEAARQQLPVVLVNRGHEERRFSSIVLDERESVRLVLDHLQALGHRHIVHIAGPQSTSTGRVRKQAFLSLCAERGLADTSVIDVPTYTRAAGFDAALLLLQAGTPRPTAVFAANDLIALGVIDAFTRHGVAVPGEISVVGHNDMPLVDLIAPPLTTVRVAAAEMSRQAAQMLLEQMQQPTLPATRRVLMPTLTVRASTAAPRA